MRQVHVREGERVRAGQVLVEFDTAALRVQLAERNATLESAKAQLVQTDRTRQVNAQLVKQNFISQNAFDTADSIFPRTGGSGRGGPGPAGADAVAAERCGGARADCRSRVQAGMCSRARRLASMRRWSASSILASSKCRRRRRLSDVAQIAAGARAVVTIEGLPERTFEGRVERINPSTEPGTRSINFYVSISNEAALLRAGMFAKVRLHVGADKPVPALPISAVRSDNGRTWSGCSPTASCASRR